MLSIWLCAQGGLKLGYGGLALTALALLLRLVYLGPDSTAEFIASLPFSTALVWLGRIGRALFVAGMLSSAWRYLTDRRQACRPANTRVAGAVSALLLVGVAAALAWLAPEVNPRHVAQVGGVALVYCAYVAIAARVPWTCVHTFGHCHKCANARQDWARHRRELVWTALMALLILPVVCWHDGAAACGSTARANPWRLPNIERGRRLAAEMEKWKHGRMEEWAGNSRSTPLAGLAKPAQSRSHSDQSMAALEEAVDEMVFEGAAPLAVFALVTNSLPGIAGDDAWDVTMYLRSKTAAPPRAALEKEVFARWATEVAPGAPAYVWYDWPSMRTKTDGQIAAMIDQARVAAGFAQQALGDYERQRLVDLVRGLAVNLDP